MKKLCIVCAHLHANPALPYQIIKEKPIDARDSGQILYCEKYPHNFDNIDNWITSHPEHFAR